MAEENQTETPETEITMPEGDSPLEQDSHEAFAQFFKDDEPKEEPKSEEPPKEEPAKEEPKSEEPPKEEPKKDEPKKDDGKLELQLLRAQNEIKKQTTEAITAKKRADENEKALKKERDERAAERAAWKSNPLKAAEQFSELTFDQLMIKAAKGDFDDKIAQLPPEVREAVEFANQAKKEKLEREAREAAEAEAAEQKTQAEAQRKEDLELAKGFLEEHQDALAFLGPDAADWFLDEIEAAATKLKRPLKLEEIKDLAKRLNDVHCKGITAHLRDERALKALLVADPSLKDHLSKAIGAATQQNPAPSSKSPAPPALSKPEVRERVETEESDEEFTNALVSKLTAFQSRGA